MNKIRNRKIKNYSDFIIVKATDYHLAKTAIKSAKRGRLSEVKITEKGPDGKLEKYAHIQSMPLFTSLLNESVLIKMEQ